MRRYQLLLVNLLLGIVLLVAAQASWAQIPEFIESDRDGSNNLLWFSEDFAKDEEGRLAWTLFRPWEQESIQATVQSNSERLRLKIASSPAVADVDECQITRGWIDHDYHAGGSIGALAKDSTHIVVGTIVGLKQGFLWGRPGTIYEIEHELAIKSPEGYSPPATYLAYMGIARIRTDEGMLCSASFRRDDPPRVGASIVMFLFSDSFGERGGLLRPPKKAIFYQNQGEKMSVPVGFELPEGNGFETDTLIDSVFDHLTLATGGE